MCVCVLKPWEKQQETPRTWRAEDTKFHVMTKRKIFFRHFTVRFNVFFPTHHQHRRCRCRTRRCRANIYESKIFMLNKKKATKKRAFVSWSLLKLTLKLYQLRNAKRKCANIFWCVVTFQSIYSISRICCQNFRLSLIAINLLIKVSRREIMNNDSCCVK
jgi:hypothetical protein